MSWLGRIKITKNTGLEDSVIDKISPVCCGAEAYELLRYTKTLDNKIAVVSVMLNSVPTKESIESLIEIALDDFYIFVSTEECSQYKIDNINLFEVQE